MGSFNYYHKFIKNYIEIMESLISNLIIKYLHSFSIKLIEIKLDIKFNIKSSYSKISELLRIFE
jgi:hypothetical protein